MYRLTNSPCGLRISRLHFWHFIFHFACMALPLISPAQNRYDILISEFLPDPLPSVGMPETSFIELKNRSGHDFNLHNWKISNGSSTSTFKSDYLLKTDSFLILCPSSATQAFSAFGPTLGLSGFPSLNNDAGDIILSSNSGNIINAIHYDKDWFGNTLKAAGGWSLELIDPASPCSGRWNWAASISSSGGTPGKKNSVFAENPDTESPSLMRSITIDSLNLLLFFDKPMDSSSVMDISNYFISDGIGVPETTSGLGPFYETVSLRMQKPLVAGDIYTVTVQGLRDCSGNEISLRNSCKAGVPVKPSAGSIIFNEILFNPTPYGSDYIELFNPGPGIIPCSSLFIAGRDLYGNIKDPVQLVKAERFLFPGEYLLLTEDPGWVLHNYPLAPASQMLLVSALPSMPDDLGKLSLLNISGEMVDELNYDHHWHSPLLADESGVSLERIRPDPPTSLASNWISASATSGYGTPGYKNSESSREEPPGTDMISAEPKIFSPDLDGFQDFLFIRYHLPVPGFMGSISIHDVHGRKVRRLVNNILWGTSGSFRWDGLDDNLNLLPMGHYIIYIELFLPDGTVKKQKLVCVLARNP